MSGRVHDAPGARAAQLRGARVLRLPLLPPHGECGILQGKTNIQIGVHIGPVEFVAPQGGARGRVPYLLTANDDISIPYMGRVVTCYKKYWDWSQILSMCTCEANQITIHTRI